MHKPSTKWAINMAAPQRTNNEQGKIMQDAQRVAAGSSFTQDLDTNNGLRDRRFMHALRNCACNGPQRDDDKMDATALDCRWHHTLNQSSRIPPKATNRPKAQSKSKTTATNRPIPRGQSVMGLARDSPRDSCISSSFKMNHKLSKTRSRSPESGTTYVAGILDQKPS